MNESRGENAAGDGSQHGPQLAGRLVLFREMAKKQFFLIVRYPVNFAAQIVTLYLFFAIVFFGGQAAASGIAPTRSFDSTLDGVIVGWFLWTMAQVAYSGLQGDITAESQWGTLEQLYLSPYGFGTIMTIKTVVNLLLSLFWGTIILTLMLVTTRRWLTIDIVTLVPITVLTLMSVVGIGFVFAGLALVYKRVNNVAQPMQFALVGLIAAPVTGISATQGLPLVQGSAMLQEAMRNGVRLWEFSGFQLGVLVATAVVYFTAGYAVFSWCADVARRRGVMGHY